MKTRETRRGVGLSIKAKQIEIAKLQEIARLQAEAAQLRVQLAQLTALEAHTEAILRDTRIPAAMRVRRAEAYLKRNARLFRRAGEVQG